MRQHKKQIISRDCLRIHPVRGSDHPALRALYALSIRHNPEGFIQDINHHGDIGACAREFQSAGGEMLGLFADLDLIGFGALRRIDQDRAELCKLHLHPDFHGNGLGRKLVTELMSVAVNLSLNKIELHVTVTQEAAIGLYRALGFAETGRQVFTVGDQRFDTIFMERVIHR